MKRMPTRKGTLQSSYTILLSPLFFYLLATTTTTTTTTCPRYVHEIQQKKKESYTWCRSFKCDPLTSITSTRQELGWRAWGRRQKETQQQIETMHIQEHDLQVHKNLGRKNHFLHDLGAGLFCRDTRVIASVSTGNASGDPRSLAELLGDENWAGSCPPKPGSNI